MDIIDVLLRLMGAFYVFAGYVASRATLTAMLVDRSIASLAAAPPTDAEGRRAGWLLAVAHLVLIGGVALLLTLNLASSIFVLGLILQGIYFAVLAPRYFDAIDTPSARGRKQSHNAFIVYGIATALVLWAHAAGRLHSPSDISAPLAAVMAGVLLACLVSDWYSLLNLRRTRSPR